jgi:hypothetical protein
LDKRQWLYKSFLMDTMQDGQNDNSNKSIQTYTNMYKSYCNKPGRINSPSRINLWILFLNKCKLSIGKSLPVHHNRTRGLHQYKVCYLIKKIMFMFFSSPCQRQYELFAITCRPSSVNFSHFNLLLWNPLAKWTETW